MSRLVVLCLGFACFALAACGETRTQRVATGAIGGAVAGEVLADEPLIGAGIGGLGGALR